MRHILVGVKPDGDLNFVRRSSARQAHWLAVNHQLDPVAADGLTLEWVQRKYRIRADAAGQPHATNTFPRLKEIVRDIQESEVSRRVAAISPLPTDEPGDFVLVLRNAAGAELNRLSYSVAGQANLSRSLERNAELQIQLDKSAYLRRRHHRNQHPRSLYGSRA